MIRRILLLAAMLASVMPTDGLAAEPAEAVDEEQLPLFRQQPHDVLILRGEQKGEYKIFPTKVRKLPEARLSEPPLTVRFLDRPADEFRIEWKYVDDIRFFERRVLADVERLVAEERFDEAFEPLEYLRQNYPLVDGLQPALENYLHQGARQELKRQHWQAALSLVNDLHALAPQRKGLADDLAAATDPLVDNCLKRGDIGAARALIARFIAKHPSHAMVASWRGRFSAEAEARMATAQRAIQDQQWTEARLAVVGALALRPELAAARDLMKQLCRQHASITVGVRMPPRDELSLEGNQRLLNAAARRDNRLLERSLVELSAIGASGGEYRPLLGTLEKDLSGRLLWRLPEEGSFTGYDLARRLWALADPRRNEQPGWNAVFAGVEVRDVFQVEAALRRPHLLPEALLAVPVVAASFNDPLASNSSAHRPYRPDRRSSTEVVYRLDKNYATRHTSAPAEITARTLPDEGPATTAILQGDIDLLDHVNPWEVGDWQSRSGDYAVEPYRVPTLHVLAFNRTHPLAKMRSFRRGLDYALDRPGMLNQLVLRGKKLAGCEVATGPFPRGTGSDDPLGYAVDPLITPRGNDPELAATLIAIAQAERATAPAAAATPEEIDTLRLAYPATSVARLAAKAIARQWEAVGVAVRLDELPPGDVGVSRQWDVLYAEVSIAEPLVDARVLLGPGGVAGGNPYVSQALEELDRVSDWSEARRVLRRIHQFVYDDVTLIPLWQLTDHYVRHRRVDGLGVAPLTLFQNVEAWRLAPHLPPENDSLWPAGAR